MANRRTIAQHTTAVASVEHTLPSVAESVHYPDSDGHFLPDNPLQARAVMNARFALEHHFDKVDNVVLEGDMFMYYEEGNPAASIAPDVYVVLDHDLGDRGVYKFWEEGKAPDFALEVISPSSQIRNAKEKRALYEQLGIGEYFLFQPNPLKRGRRLVGYRLWGNTYEAVPEEPDGTVCSEALGVSFRVEGKNLRVRNLATGQDYAWIEENRRNLEAVQADAQVAREETQAAREETQAARKETQAARKETQTARKEAQTARKEAQTAREETQAAQAWAEAEAEARRQLEMRYAELEALLGKPGHQDH